MKIKPSWSIRKKDGGIDLTPANMNVADKKLDPRQEAFGNDKRGIRFQFDPAMLQQLQNAHWLCAGDH